MTFSKTPARTSVPSGSTRGKPKSAPANGAAHNRTNKELQMSRLTVQTLAQMLADQQAATNAQMQTLGGIVADLAATVRAIIPSIPAAVVAAPTIAAPVPAVVVAAESVAAATDSAIDKRNAALARGRATAAANRAARKAGTTPTATAPAPVAAPVSAPAPKVTQLTKARQNGTTVHLGRVGNAAYIVAWNRTAAAWDWQITSPKGNRKGRVPQGDAARAVAFRALNAAAAALGQAQVRAGK